MDRDKVLAAAKAAAPKVQLEEYREAVQELRNKGYTWREVADFLNEQGVQTDHTRVYRAFSGQPTEKQTESRQVAINRITYLGERLTNRKKAWNVMEIEMPSKLGPPITVIGYAWGTGMPQFKLNNENSVLFKNATLFTKSGSSFPMAFIKADLKTSTNKWANQEIYIVPKWEALL